MPEEEVEEEEEVKEEEEQEQEEQEGRRSRRSNRGKRRNTRRERRMEEGRSCKLKGGGGAMPVAEDLVEILGAQHRRQDRL